MTAPHQLGAPIGPAITQGRGAREFDHIPGLHELLDGTVGPPGGWPGITYAQACIHNVANAAERMEKPAHMRPIGGATYYTIVGPRGSCQMALVGCGERIRGASPEAGARLFFTDGEVERLTGLELGKRATIWFRPQPEPTAPVAAEGGSDAPAKARPAGKPAAP